MGGSETIAPRPGKKNQEFGGRGGNRPARRVHSERTLKLPVFDDEITSPPRRRAVYLRRGAMTWIDSISQYRVLRRQDAVLLFVERTRRIPHRGPLGEGIWRVERFEAWVGGF